MTNDKDLFSQLDELFEDIDVDQAAILAGGEIEPTHEDYEKELIEKLNNNEIELTEEVIEEVKNVITEGGEVDQRITAFLRKKFDIQEEVEVVEDLRQVVEPTQQYTQQYTEQNIEPAEPAMALDYIDSLAGELSSYVKSNNLSKKSQPEIDQTLTEKVEYLTNQLGIIRQTLDEQGKTIVSGIGQGGDGQLPGSGEVRLQKQDDVDMDGITAGQTLCWDPDMFSGTGGWYPCDGGGGSGGGGGTIQPPTNGMVFGCTKVKDCADLYWGTQDEYTAWYNDGAVDGPLGSAKLVSSNVRAINGAIALEYEASGVVPGAFASDDWYAVGVIDCLGDIVDTNSISTDGISGPFGPEGYFLVYADPDDCGEGQSGCDATPVDAFGCNPVLPAVDPFVNELRYGTQEDAEADPNDDRGQRVMDGAGSPIAGVTEIIAIAFEGCDKVTMNGLYNVYFKKDGGIKTASLTDDDPDANLRSFFIFNAECDTTAPPPPPPQTQLIGCLAADGCKELSDKDPDGNVVASPIGQIYFGDGDPDTGELVTNASGANVDDAQKLQFVATKKDEPYVIDDVTGDVTATWVVTYTDWSSNTKQVEWDATLNPTDCTIGFFISGGDQVCLNPAEDEDDDGDQMPWPGLITGCKEIDPSLANGNLMWGDGTTGVNAVDDIANVGNPVTDCQRIIFVFSTHPDVDDTNKVGQWQCLYRDFAGDYKIGYTPTATVDGSVEGFYIETSAPDQCIDDDPDFNFQLGIFTGCREPLTPGPLYWGTRLDYNNGDTTTIVKNNLGVDIGICKKVYRPMSVDGEQYFGIYIDGTDRARIALHPQDGSTTSSPPNGFYTLGGCSVDDDDDNCPLDDRIYADPYGCRVVDAPGTDLLWGNETTSEVVDTDVTKILSVYTEDRCDNGYGKWVVIYNKIVGTDEEMRQAERFGFNPADPIEDTDNYFLDTSVVECAEDPDSIEGGQPVLGIITGCRRTLESAGTTLHWGDGTDTSEIVKDVDGNDVTDAKFIVGVVSFNADDTKFGDWICLYKKGDGTYGTAITYGQSPTDGYFLEGSNCDPVQCDGGVYFGFLPDCNSVDPNFEAGLLYWNNGDDAVDNIALKDGTGNSLKARKVLATLTVDECQAPDFDITQDQEWLGLYFDEDNKLSLTGSQLGKSPNGGYYIEVDEVNSFCSYDNGAGGICNGDDDCPLGFVCVGGICEQLKCDATADCPDGFDCVNGICLRPCGEGDEALCPPGSHCVQIGDLTYCIPGGNCNGECPEGYFCLNGDCVIIECNLENINGPIHPGDDDEGCPPGYECYLGQCLKPCPGGDADCPPGFKCIDGYCFPEFGPCPPLGCPPGYECILGACRQVCNDTSPCPAGYECYNGACFPVCDSGNCPAGHECVELPSGISICFPTFDACKDDTDCGGNFECINGICLPVCDDTNPCPTGFQCFEGNCVPLCDIDNPCPPGFHCLGGRCVPTLSCDDTANCPTGYECIDGFCRKICDPVAPEPCPPGFECIDLGNGTHCFPKCDVDSCPPGHECIGGICIPPMVCTRPNACPTGYVCVDGICRPECDNSDPNNNCPPGQICDNNSCWTPCDPTTPCPPGFNCIGGLCVPELGCNDDTDCPTGYECIGGICREVCTDTSDCPSGFECWFGHCFPTCDVDKLCPDGHICHDGVCIPQTPCTDDTDCPTDHTCDEGICKQNCSDTPDCPDGYICIDGKCEIIGGPDGNCLADDHCPDGFICVDGFCRRECADPTACPPGYMCIGGACFPGIPEGPCADGACPPGYECFMGICREPCSSTGACPPGFECNDPPGGCWPQECDPTNPCPAGFECLDGRCRQICDDTTPCPDGYNCVEINPGLTVCLPITIDPPGPEQPVNPGPNSHPAVGCEEVDKCGYLYWGSDEDYANATGELQQNADGPILVKKIELIQSTDVYENGFGTYTVYYRSCDTDDIKIHSVYKQSPEGGMLQSFFIKPDDSSVCIDFGDTHEPVEGLIAGCKETDRGGTLHWGTIPEAIGTAPNEPLTYEDGTQIVAKGIMQVFSIDCVNPQDGAIGQVGTWQIVYQLTTGVIEFTTVYGRSSLSGPEGAFMRASAGSICIDDTHDIVSTREVLLVNSPRVMKTRNKFYGKTPQGSADIIGPNGEIIRYETQEQANILNLEILDLLDDKKPTVHVIPDINDVVGHYVPQRGDLWIDPTDYSIYVCDTVADFPDPDDLIENPEANLVWMELGAASGGDNPVAASGSNIFLQDAEPSSAIVKHADIWIDAETYLMYTYNGSSTSWVSVTGDVKAVLNNRFEVHIDKNPPDKNETRVGDMWFDSEVAEMRVAYIPDGSTSVVWVPVQGSGHKAVPANPFSVDDDQNEEINELRAEISRLSTRLTALEANN